MKTNTAISILKRLKATRPLPVKVLFVAAAFHLAPFSLVVLLPFALTPTLMRVSNMVRRSVISEAPETV